MNYSRIRGARTCLSQAGPPWAETGNLSLLHPPNFCAFGVLGIEPSLRTPKARVLPVYDTPKILAGRSENVNHYTTPRNYDVSGKATVCEEVS